MLLPWVQYDRGVDEIRANERGEIEFGICAICGESRQRSQSAVIGRENAEHMTCDLHHHLEESVMGAEVAMHLL